MFQDHSIVPECKKNFGHKGYPVIVHIHGGAFHYFSSEEFGSKYIMQTGKVIFVTLNYRLGVLGQ